MDAGSILVDVMTPLEIEERLELHYRLLGCEVVRGYGVGASPEYTAVTRCYVKMQMKREVWGPLSFMAPRFILECSKDNEVLAGALVGV